MGLVHERDIMERNMLMHLTENEVNIIYAYPIISQFNKIVFYPSLFIALSIVEIILSINTIKLPNIYTS